MYKQANTKQIHIDSGNPLAVTLGASVPVELNYAMCELGPMTEDVPVMQCMPIVKNGISDGHISAINIPRISSLIRACSGAIPTSQKHHLTCSCSSGV
jgi:hypothetical protein